MKVYAVLFVAFLCFACGEARPGAAGKAKTAVSSSPAAAKACRTTPYPELCGHILATTPPSAPANHVIAAISSYALHLTSAAYAAALKDLKASTSTKTATSKYTSSALEDCMDLMQSSMDQLRLSIDRLSQLSASSKAAPAALHAQLMDAQVALSASFTFQDTCSDELSLLRPASDSRISSASSRSSAAALLLLQRGSAITQSIAVAMSLADSLQHRIVH